MKNGGLRIEDRGQGASPKEHIEHYNQHIFPHSFSDDEKKEELIKNFLDMLKSSSIDCIIHSEINKPLNNGYKCYNWPINKNVDKLSFTQNINEDSVITKYKMFEKTKIGKGKVVSKNGIKYVLLNDKLYDYYSYKNAGVLLLV